MDHTHCSSITGAWHEVSSPDAQPCQGQLHYHFLLCLFCSLQSNSVFPLSEYRAVCNSTDVLSATWQSQNPAHSSRLQNWLRLADRKASWQHWVMAKSLMGSFPESLCHIKRLCSYNCHYVLLANGLGFSDVPQSLSSPHAPAWFTVFACNHFHINI